MRPKTFDMPDKRAIIKFNSFVKKTRDKKECWIWQGRIHKSGYGSFHCKRNGKGIIHGAHRVSWAIKNKRPPKKGMIICHKCDNPPCCNPNHLFEGTFKDNQRDSWSKNRNPRKKILFEGVVEIKQTTTTENKYKMAEKFRVSVSHIEKIMNGQKWSWV